jgi:hypothetical protein
LPFFSIFSFENSRASLVSSATYSLLQKQWDISQIQSQSESHPMNPQSPKVLHAIPDLAPVCSHRTKTGCRCHLPALENSVLCFRHTPKYAVQAEADLTAAFGDRLLTNPQRAASINSFVGRLAVLVVQNRVSPRRAAVLADLSNLLLRSWSEIDRELDTGRFPSKVAAAAVHPSASVPESAGDITTQEPS